MDFYSNENFPLPVVEKLRALGHNVLTMQESGKADQSLPDPAVLDFAREQKRVLLTLNRRYFIRLHESCPDHCGILACKLDKDFEQQALRIDSAVRKQASLAGKSIRINREG